MAPEELKFSVDRLSVGICEGVLIQLQLTGPVGPRLRYELY